ncbi:benzoate/H(+) symporter BenE family transporter [Vibrio sp. PP-XX7]
MLGQHRAASVTSLGNYSYNEAIGAFIVSSILIFLSGITGIFQKFMNMVPKEITSALLAGILLNFGLKLFASSGNALNSIFNCFF